jgi:peptide/nickel transport system ATP-binding protein
MEQDRHDEVLRVENLQVRYRTPAGEAQAVRGVSFTIARGERFGLVGESGSGKSTTANAILRLIKPPGYIAGGRVLIEGIDVLGLRDEELRRLRWKKLALVMQGAMNSLNPVMRVGEQIADAIKAHSDTRTTATDLEARITTLLGTVGLPARAYRMFPHELSGGMKQRACIAMAMVLEPALIIADEPTSALDVVVQRVVAQTLIEVGERLGASLLLIGHDMGLQARLVHRLGVMYAGELVEIGTVEALFKQPRHPYTQLLISSVPSLKVRTLPKPIPGLPPSLVNPPAGCVFHPRCPHAMAICREVAPTPREVAPGQIAACHLYNEARNAEPERATALTQQAPDPIA